jgi:biotin carboxylase
MPPTRPALLLLGGLAASWNQPYVQAARDRDLVLLLLDRPSPYVESTIASWRANEPHPVEVGVARADQLAAIVALATAWRERYDIRGVCCLRESYVEPASVVADLLDLPGPGLRAGRVCRNKYLQRRLLPSLSPACMLVEAARRDETVAGWSRFPLVVKPLGREGSSGVRVATDASGLRDCLDEYDPDEPVLFEERVTGQEYSVESLSDRGKPCYVGITEKRTTEQDGDFFVEMGHTTPPTGLSAEDRERLLDAHRTVLDALRFDTGMAHAEYRVDARGRVIMMEIAARPPGDAIMALHSLATGASLEEAVVALAVGESVSVPPQTRFARQVYLPQRPGVFIGVAVAPELGVAANEHPGAAVDFTRIGRATADEPPAVRRVAELKARGATLGPIRQSTDRAAMVVIDAPTGAELDDLEARCRRAVRLRIVARQEETVPR